METRVYFDFATLSNRRNRISEWRVRLWIANFSSTFHNGASVLSPALVFNLRNELINGYPGEL